MEQSTNVKSLEPKCLAILMCFNVLHMQSPEVTAEVKGQWSPPNNFACSVQMKREKRLNSPSILSNLQGKLLSQIHWGDWWGTQDNSSPKEDLDLGNTGVVSVVFLDMNFKGSIP